MKQKSPITAIIDSPRQIKLPSVGMTDDMNMQRKWATDDLMLQNALCYNTYHMPMLCRWRLYDRWGRIIFTSRRISLGDPMPQIKMAVRSWSINAWIDYSPWHLKVNPSLLVPRRLASEAVRAVVTATPDLPRDIRTAEIEVARFDLTPAQPRQILTPARRHKRVLSYSRKNRNFAVDNNHRSPHMNLDTIVRDTISRHHLLEKGDKVIVALSGGADSVALLSILVDLGYDCMAAHCNFHLRGDESQRDMRHAETVCSRLGVDLAVKDFDVEARRALTGESIEMACRSLRYEWFDSLLTRERGRAVAVGHHREDQIETVMLNIFRGTGIAGLCGIRYRRDYIIRPLLDCSRHQIEEYLADKGLDYITDSSNFSDAHLRNRLRNKIIPLIKDLFPGAENAILSTIANIDDARRLYDKKIDDYRRRYVRDNGAINVAMLAAEIPHDAVTVLRELIKGTGLTTSQCRDIINSSGASGLRFDSGGITVAELDRGILSLTRHHRVMTPDVYDIDLSRDVISPVNLRISRHHISEFNPERDPSVLYLDESVLHSEHHWTLRRPRKGDRIKPFGMSGSKLLSDLYTDAKYSAADKRNAWLLTCDDQIVWAVGLRASSLFPVTPDTRNYLKIKHKQLII